MSKTTLRKLFNTQNDLPVAIVHWFSEHNACPEPYYIKDSNTSPTKAFITPQLFVILQSGSEQIFRSPHSDEYNMKNAHRIKNARHIKAGWHVGRTV